MPESSRNRFISGSRGTLLRGPAPRVLLLVATSVPLLIMVLQQGQRSPMMRRVQIVLSLATCTAIFLQKCLAPPKKVPGTSSGSDLSIAADVALRLLSTIADTPIDVKLKVSPRTR